MRIIYIDPVGGLAGDMLCAGLFDAGLDFNIWNALLKQKRNHTDASVASMGLSCKLLVCNGDAPSADHDLRYALTESGIHIFPQCLCICLSISSTPATKQYHQ